MPNLFDEFDLEVQKINTDIMLLEDSCSDSVAHCSSGSGCGGGTTTTPTTPSHSPTCFSECN